MGQPGCPQVLLEAPPAHAPQSNGSGENAAAQANGGDPDLGRIQGEVPVAHPILLWLVEHAAEIVTKQMAGHGGRRPTPGCAANRAAVRDPNLVGCDVQAAPLRREGHVRQLGGRHMARQAMGHRGSLGGSAPRGGKRSLRCDALSGAGTMPRGP